MARIPESEIERLKGEVSLLRLVEDAGIALVKRGQDYAACCPFHEEKTASFVLSPARNLFHCFGCGAAGGPMDWVMRRNGVSFRHAVELLREGLGGTAEAAVKRTTIRSLPPPVAFDADDRALLGQVVEYYHQTLKQAPEALAYLAARGLSHPELIERFKLGYANRTLGLRLPDKARKAGAEIRARLERLGLYRASGHEHFNGSLVVPVLGPAGEVLEIYGRKLHDNLRSGTPKHLYLPGPHRGVWNAAGLSESREVILCEALLDALTFWAAGYRNVTAAYGTQGFTADHLAAFRAAGVERVLIAYDRDAAGDRAAAALAERLRAEGFACWRILFPHGLDANAYALKFTPATQSLGGLIRKAEWLGEGKAPAREILPSSPPPSLAAPAPQAPLSPPLPAAAVPEGAREGTATISESELVMSFADRRYRVRGLSRSLTYDVLKINLLASRGESFHVDTLDLSHARARASFHTQAALELGLAEDVIKADLARLLLQLEQVQEAAIQQARAPKEPEPVSLSEAERQAALDLLRSPALIERILADFEACGVVGEATNKLVGTLAAVSRKLDSPLAVLVQSSSAAGKSALMEAVLAFVPEEDRVQYSAMTGQSLFYMGQTSLKHRILAIAEEEGAHRAAYALKLLQSEGALTIASTGSDANGTLVTQDYRVEGPTMLMMTTTAIDIDEELLNRCLVLTVDEDRDQTRAIHRRQREKRTLAGLVRRQEKQAILTLHRNAQRLLRPLAVVNPYADRLTFLDSRTRTRRDHEKYLTLIDAIALLHQYQRPVRSVQIDERSLDYVEVTLADIALANRLAHEVLGRSLDELPPQTRRMLGAVQALVAQRAAAEAIRPAEVRFGRADIRRQASLSDTQCRLHLDRLTALEYLLVHRGRRGQSFDYELLFDGDPAGGAAHLAGLIDPESLADAGMTASSRGAEAENAGSSRPHRGANTASSRPAPMPETPVPPPLCADAAAGPPTPKPPPVNGKILSYPQAGAG